MKENDDIRQQVEILEKENKALKIKLAQKFDDEKFVTQHEDKDEIKITKKYSWEKCCLNFLSKDKLNKHQSEMHKAKLTF